MSGPTDEAAVARMQRAAKALYGPATAIGVFRIAIWVLAGVGGVAAGLLAGHAVWTLGVGAAILGVGLLLLQLLLSDRDRRDALELLHAHDHREMEEWRRLTGTRQPMTRRGMQRWLERHPGDPNAIPFLVGLGRLDEAERALDAMPIDGPATAWSIALQRASLEADRGGTPDVAALRAGPEALEDRQVRDERSECLAILEARLAFEAGADPFTILAETRRTLPRPRWRVPTVLQETLMVGSMIVIAATLVMYLFLGRDL